MSITNMSITPSEVITTPHTIVTIIENQIISDGSFTQSDWDEADTGSGSFIKNKPDTTPVTELDDVAIKNTSVEINFDNQQEINEYMLDNVAIGENEISSEDTQVIQVLQPKLKDDPIIRVIVNINNGLVKLDALGKIPSSLLDENAADIPFAPFSTIEATDTQAAVEEVHSELSADIGTAQSTADTAEGKADTAIINAAAADSKAVTAQNTADTAITNASTADGKAVAAQNTADTAEGKADAAQNTADTALIDASTAQSTADQAEGKADSAQSTANTALTNASTAQSTADAKVASLVAGTNVTITGDPQNPTITATMEAINGGDMEASTYDPQGKEIDIFVETQKGIDDAATADGKAVSAQGTADTAIQAAATADGKAVTADGKADTAQGTANTALTNASTALSAANSKVATLVAGTNSRW